MSAAIEQTTDAEHWRRVVTWDWREQPDLAELATAIRELSDGRVHLAAVDTGSDQIAVVLSRGRLSRESVAAAWDGYWS